MNQHRLLYLSGAAVEWYYPFVFGLAGAAAAYFYGIEFYEWALERAYDFSSLYGTTFDLASILAAFLFTIYTFIVTTESGFIGKARGSSSFRLLLDYTLRSGLLSIVLTVVSAIATFLDLTPVQSSSSLLFFTGWSGLVFWTVGSFVRSARLFAAFAQQHH